MKAAIILFLLMAMAAFAYGISVEDQWKAYKIEHKRKFDSEEETVRFEIFKETVRRVEEQNAKGESTFQAGQLNQFADRKPEEKPGNVVFPERPGRTNFVFSHDELIRKSTLESKNVTNAK